MPPRGICKPIRTWEWDPRKESVHNLEGHRHVLHHYGMSNHTYMQVPCERLEDCWDMSKCAAPIRIYGYGATAIHMALLAAQRYPNHIQWTPHAEDACLLLALVDSFATPQQMHSSPSWNAGRNHFLFGGNGFFGTSADIPFKIETNFDHASVGTNAMMDANIRLGYVIPLPYMRMDPAGEFQAPANFNSSTSTINNNRTLLVSFKGNIFHMDQVWWQHRYLAYEYWEQAPDVLVDVQCKLSKRFKGPRRKKQYETSVDSFASQLMNSTFAFCPGGGSFGSFRFAEALSLGAIPVVTSEFVAPLAPDVDWSGCLVRVSEARIIDILRILRGIVDVEARQERCRFLFDCIIGWQENGRLDPMSRILPLALRIWSRRIASYLAMR